MMVIMAGQLSSTGCLLRPERLAIQQYIVKLNSDRLVAIETGRAESIVNTTLTIGSVRPLEWEHAEKRLIKTVICPASA